MSSEGNVQFPSGSSILNPISLGGQLPASSAATASAAPPPNLLGGYSMGPSSSNGPMASPVSGPLAQQMPPASVLKVINLPADLSPREAGLIFSLVSDDVLSVDLNEHEQVVTAVFKTPNTCLTAGRLLDGRFIFGQNHGPAKVEYDPALAFENLRLSNAGISPPSHASSQSHPHNAGGPGLDNFQKRASIGNQRSRFLFSDPFAGTTTTTTPPNGNNPGSIDLSDLTGKSLLLMKPNDGRDYENMSRDPWGSQSQGNIGFSSNPQTPGLSAVHSSYDWGSGPSANLPASASASSQAQTSSQQQAHNHQHAPQLQHSHSSSGNSQMAPFVTSAPADRRRTSSFFNGPTAHIAGQPPAGLEPHVQSQAQAQAQAQQKAQQSQSQNAQPSTSSHTSTQHEQQHQAPPTAASIISQGPTQQASSNALPQAAASTSASNRNGPLSNSSSSQNAASAQASVSSSSTSARSVSKDVPDLSLLARVPPPANPADQNPPCNTLYVGNLPPDATETELRSLFAPQKGFRRLSFRTKNQSGSSNGSSGHNHGPMCFVEFEDVAHATIALAELYGRALPRPNGSNGKGGIRLSFSKNPLGVRGPGNPRRGSTNAPTSSAGGTSNGVGNYGYSNYH